MLETARYEIGRRLRGTAVLTIGLSVLSAFMVWYFTVIPTDTADMDQLLESFPPAMREAFGIETLSTIEGFLGAEIYSFIWVLGLGLYFAYSAGGLIAGDIERDRMDLLLSFPVSRARLLVEKFSSLLVPLLTFNVVVAIVVYVGVISIGESIDPVRLVMTHALSIPYLLTCAAIGTVFSVLVDRADVAKRISIGLIFALYVLDSIAASAEDVEWIQYISPTHYYDPTTVLVEGTYNLVDAGILLVVFLVLLIASQLLFQRRDI